MKRCIWGVSIRILAFLGSGYLERAITTRKLSYHVSVVEKALAAGLMPWALAYLSACDAQAGLSACIAQAGLTIANLRSNILSFALIMV